MSTEKLTLFIPPIDPDDVVWSGLPLQPEEAIKIYDVDDVQTSTEVNPFLANPKQLSQSTVYAIGEQVSDHITFLNFSKKDVQLLREAVERSRVVKDDYEIALIKHANEVSTAAHIAVIKAAKTAKNERELDGLFLKECIDRGCREQAYHGIFASGTNAATLHYVKNDEPLKDRQLVLVDAGAEHHCYAADITRAFPISGKFSPEAKAIYSIVLQMQYECIDLIKEGVVWDDVHAHAHRVAIAGLLKLGVLKGEPEEIFASRVSVPFFPHGLGHYLGMDTHDCGGNPNYKDKDPMYRYLRVRGKLPAGSVITVEPGIYFCAFMIDPALKDPKLSKYIDAEVLKQYWAVGGVRIEGKQRRHNSLLVFMIANKSVVDDVVVTKDGSVDLTDTPKTIDEIEALLA
jgi:Xaa-Pro dipeptidase